MKRIYPTSSKPELDPLLFIQPPSEFRGAPFWAWNGRIDERELREQLRVFKDMGLGGAHLHVRVGLQIPYLSDEFMGLIRACVDECKKLGLRAWLYDEDRWPSGAAGGIVTKNPAFGMRHLLVTRTPYEHSRLETADPNDSAARSGRSNDGELVRRFAVRVGADGQLEGYRSLRGERLELGGNLYAGSLDSGEFAVWAYVERNRAIPWFNNQTYLDTMNPEAVREFVRVTHDRYREIVGDEFGSVIPAIFTDEPQYNRPSVLSSPNADEDLVFPFTTDFDDTFRAAYGESFLDRLPELVWDGPDSSVVRYRFFEHASERFAAAFADVIGGWCLENGIALTGHLMEEPTLHSQTHATGEAMRSYRSFQLPGIDLLCNRVELTTAKQAQSAARQFGREGVLSELYGVTGWHFDFRGHKLQGDWQAALGVTARVHHLAWVTMEGEAKRDYPAAIGYQSPWHRRYPVVEDHFARLNTALTRGRPVCRVAVVHPIESYWMSWGPRSTTERRRSEMDRRFSDLTNWLLRNQIDFDFLSETHLPALAATEDSVLTVGEMRYDLVLLPALETIRSTTLSLLERFIDGGGEVVIAGELPTHLDGTSDERPAAVLSRARGPVPFSETALLAASEPYRDVRLARADGGAEHNIVYQLREDGECRWLFLAHVDPPREVAVPEVEVIRLFVRGHWDATLFETSEGLTEDVAYLVDETGQGEGWTELRFAMTVHDSLLLRLSPRGEGCGNAATFASSPERGADALGTDNATRGSGSDRGLLAVPASRGTGIVLGKHSRVLLPQPSRYELSEPNVLVLDQAEWRLDDGEWQAREEVLRLDQAARRMLGWPQRGGRMAQPWVEPDDSAEGRRLSMRFHLDANIALSGCSLALERPGESVVRLDGRNVEMRDTGYWVDRSIRTIPLPEMAGGSHEVEVTTTITRRSGAEWCYLLGSFGVRVLGREAIIEELPDRIRWADITHQGLPFYAGNITYTVEIPADIATPCALQVSDFAAPVLDVRVTDDNTERTDFLGSIAWSPYAVALTKKGGDRRRGGSPSSVSITAYGNRQNAFGPLHCSLRQLSWYGPPAWRTEGTAWTYEYRLEPAGILATPALLC